MESVLDVTPFIEDLKVCLIKNRTDVPFITSDDPAVAENRWYLEDRRVIGCSFGFRASGLVTLLPLTPDILCLAYDGDVYSVQHDRNWVDVRNVGDVKALNQHQILNCFANLYVPEFASEDDLKAQVSDCGNRRVAVRHRVNYAVLDSTEGEYARYVVTQADDSTRSGDALVHTQTLHPKPTRWPSFLRWRTPGAVYTNGTAVKYVRGYHTQTSNSIHFFKKERVL